jgi:hypothetical protein
MKMKHMIGKLSCIVKIMSSSIIGINTTKFENVYEIALPPTFC